MTATRDFSCSAPRNDGERWCEKSVHNLFELLLWYYTICA